MNTVTAAAQAKPARAITQSTRVVIIGAGFAGLNAARALKNAAVQITLVDRNNYHLFQPLLYQVATAGLSPADISTPTRHVFRHQPNCRVIQAKVTGIDRHNRCVLTDRQSLSFDFLIVATGARHDYFGHNDWAEVAPGLKDIDDATAIRRRILSAFERAETTEAMDERARLMTFCVVGGGPTGVEMAGAIAELAKKTLNREFRLIQPAKARVVLLEAGDRILSNYPEKLSRKATMQLQKLGVEVCTGHAVSDCQPGRVEIQGGEALVAENIIWAAGVKASPAARWLDATSDRHGKVCVNADLTLPGHHNVFVVGDTAACTDASGRPVPAVAPAAKQMGRYVARVIQAVIGGKDAPPPFKYRDWGRMATIGRKAAVADFDRFTLSGYPAWLSWSLVHILFLIGFRNRAVVMLNWAWQYLFFTRGARLITGENDNDDDAAQQ